MRYYCDALSGFSKWGSIWSGKLLLIDVYNLGTKNYLCEGNGETVFGCYV